MADIKSSSINVTDLDFDDISSNLKNFLKGQDKLKDYNFEGSTLSMLIDLMSYSAHIGAVNTNIAASELFLDSAQMRKNVVSRAKDLGFTPASETSAKATLDMTIENAVQADGSSPTTSQMTLPKGSRFQSNYDGTNYVFTTTSSVTPSKLGNTFNYTGINIAQGIFVEENFVFDSQIANQKFVMGNERVDRGTMTVSVNSGGVLETFTKSTDVSTVTSTSKVYFTQENEDEFTEVYFGDGILGKKLLDGDIITVQYILVNETHANGAKLFTLISTILGFTDVTIATKEIAASGSEKESISSIKFKASKSYSSQNRLVTLNDYKAKLQEFYPSADALAIWGGEDNVPPEYGKVFISLKPANADYLTETEKANVKTSLNNLNMLTVRPVIVDAEIIKILITTVFKYDEKATTLSKGELETIVKNSITTFDSTNLNTFDSIFRHSNLAKDIDASDAAVISNVTNIRLRKNISVILGELKKTGYTVDFSNPFYHPHDGHAKAGGGIVGSTGFKIVGDTTNTYYFDEDGSGNLRRYYLDGSTRVYSDNTAGTINYTTGVITVNAINIETTVLVDNTVDFTVIPNSNDVVATRGKLIDIDANDISVTGELDTIASGDSSAGVGYNSTSSYNY
tara:strand:+ start:873 stop:2753 length:1881 start_codon:yes stop_codon:yes gene_type:complete